MGDLSGAGCTRLLQPSPSALMRQDLFGAQRPPPLHDPPTTSLSWALPQVHAGKHPRSPQLIWTPSCSHRPSSFSVGFKLRTGVRRALGTCCPRRERRWGGDPQTRTCRVRPAPPRLAALPKVREVPAAETWPLRRASCPLPASRPTQKCASFSCGLSRHGSGSITPFRAVTEITVPPATPAHPLFGGTRFLCPMRGSRPTA